MGRKKQKRKPLNPREVMLIRALCEGRSFRAAALEAGYSEPDLGTKGWLAFQRIKVKTPEIMNDLGLDQRTLVNNYLKPLLNATDVKVFKANGIVIQEEMKDEDGNITQEKQMQDGGLIYSEPLVAWGPRKEGLDMAFKMHGSYARPVEEEDKSQVINQITVVIEDVSREGEQRGLSRKSSHTITAETKGIQ